MKPPKTIEDLEALIADGVEENLHLDYKDSRALSVKWPGDLSKDVSAFANSDGGVLIYGIREENHMPSAIDDGIDNIKFTKERIEHHLRSNIAPRLEGLLIHRIPLDGARSAFVIEVPKSHRSPHQDRVGMKYYKRHNFESVPMEDYELSDLRARARTLAPLVTFDIEIRSAVFFLFVIANPGDAPALDVQFAFSEPLTWEKDPPGIITNGIKVLPPRREYRVFYGVSYDIFSEIKGRRTHFDVDISYFHPTINQRISEVVSVDLGDYLGTWPAELATKELEETMKKSLAEIRDQLKRVADGLQEMTAIVRPSGLQVSVNTLEGLARSFGHQPRLSKFDPRRVSASFFADVLGVDTHLAYAIWNHFKREHPENLEAIPGISAAVIARVRDRFSLEPFSGDGNTSTPEQPGT